ncbi:hypothetical protein BH20VER3_BH20VER3_12360 [soil metagenome]
MTEHRPPTPFTFQCLTPLGRGRDAAAVSWIAQWNILPVKFEIALQESGQRRLSLR